MNRSCSTIACPCGGGSVYSVCCQVAHNNRGAVTTPEQLMRSRYSAFVMNLIDYLVATHWLTENNERRACRVALSNRPKLYWQALEVLSSDVVADNEGYVEFKAFYTDSPQGEWRCLHEKSRFWRVEQEGVFYWYYVDGILLSAG